MSSSLWGFWRKFWRKREAAPSSPAASVASAESPPPGAKNWKLKFGYMSIVGDVREHNEDNYHIPIARSIRGVNGGGGNGRGTTTTIDYQPEVNESGCELFIVADGMGGQLAGEQASKMAVEIIPQEIGRRLSSRSESEEVDVVAAVRDSMAEANKHILALSHIETEYTNMGTTVVLCLFRSDRAYIAGIGDSRAYRLRGNEFKQLTKDHSLADALLDAGTISAAEVENHRFKHVLYLYLGSKDARTGPENVQVLDIQVGDRFLLASDGLTGVVRDEHIAETLASIDDPQKSADELIELARRNFSKDNITCIVIHVVEGGV